MRYIKGFIGGFFSCAAVLAAVLLITAIASFDFKGYVRYSMSLTGDVFLALYFFELIEVKWLGIKNNT
jgi:hypothetical protein